MTNAAQTTSTAAAANADAPRANWPQRFGALKSLEVKSGRRGSYGIITLQCGKFEQTAFIFNEKVLKKAQEAASKAHAAGVTAQLWMKGPIESVEKGGFSKDEMKIVYLSDNTKYEGDAAPEANETDGVSESTAAEAASRDLDDEIPF